MAMVQVLSEVNWKKSVQGYSLFIIVWYMYVWKFYHDMIYVQLIPAILKSWGKQTIVWDVRVLKEVSGEWASEKVLATENGLNVIYQGGQENGVWNNEVLLYYISQVKV